MKPLTAKDLLLLLYKLDKQGQDLAKVPIYIGDDEELNGVHSAFYCEAHDDKDGDFIEFIESSAHEIKFKGTAILIS